MFIIKAYVKQSQTIHICCLFYFYFLLPEISHVETITNYANAIPGAASQADRIPALPRFSSSAMEALEAHRSASEQGYRISERSMVFENHLAQYHRIITQYQELHDYVHWGRQAMLEEIATAENSYRAEERSIIQFGPVEKQAIAQLLITYAQKIEELKT